MNVALQHRSHLAIISWPGSPVIHASEKNNSNNSNFHTHSVLQDPQLHISSSRSYFSKETIHAIDINSKRPLVAKLSPD